MEIEISDTKEMSDNLLSLDGIDLEETGTGKCLTLEGITNENETAEELKKYADNGEFELNIEDASNQLDIKIDDDINKTNLNEGDDFGVKNSDVLHNVTDKEDKNKHLYEVDNKVPATETPSVQNLNSEIVGETEKNNVITEQEDLIHSTCNSNNSNDVQDTVQLDITDINKDQKHEEDEHEEVSLENILQKTKNDQSDFSDSEFDFDLPEKSKEPQRHIKSSETSVAPPKTVVSVSDIDFAFSSASPVEEQNVKKNSNEFKIENESDKKKSDLINYVSKDPTDVSDEITKFTKVIEEEGQGQESSNVTSPQKKRAPDIPPTTIITQYKTDSKVDSNRVQINDDKKVMAANGNVATETEEQETVTTNAALRHAMDEWDNVQTIEAGFSDSKSGAQGSVPKIVQAMPLLSFHEMYDHFKTCDFSSVKPNIQTHIERHGFAAFKNFLFGPPKLHRDLLSDRENVFCVAGSSLDNTNNIHLRSLQTIYRTLTGSRFDCGRYGNHWEEIGFQGNDPSTDLRGAGMLGLANLIHFLSDPRKKPLAQDIYKLSLHPTQNFPFCVVGINISRITLQSLREDLLNKECNKRKDVFEVVNDFYVGLYLQLYQVWKFQGKTIADSGNVIKHIETTAKKSPHHVFKKLEEYLSKKKTGKSTSAVDLESMDIGNDNFLGVCETEAGQY